MTIYRKWHDASYRQRLLAGEVGNGDPHFEYQATQRNHWVASKLMNRFVKYGISVVMTYKQFWEDCCKRLKFKTSKRQIGDICRKLQKLGLIKITRLDITRMMFEPLDIDGLKAYVLKLDTLISDKKKKIFVKNRETGCTRERDRMYEVVRQDVSLYTYTIPNSLPNTLAERVVDKLEEEKDSRREVLWQASRKAAFDVFKKDFSQGKLEALYAIVGSQDAKESIRNPYAMAIRCAKSLARHYNPIPTQTSTIISQPTIRTSGRFDDLIKEASRDMDAQTSINAIKRVYLGDSVSGNTDVAGMAIKSLSERLNHSGRLGCPA